MRRSRDFRLKVRGERLKARSFYRFALNYFYVVARGRGVAIVVLVVIVALAGLVVLGGGGARDTRSPKGGGCYRTITKNGNSVFIEITA